MPQGHGFPKFLKNLEFYHDLGEIIDAAKQDKNFTQFRSFLSSINSGYLELGSASQCIKLCLGKTGQRVTLLREFKDFLSIRYPFLVSSETLSAIEEVSLRYRNPAVHERNFDANDLEEVRKKCFTLIRGIVDFRSVPNQNC
jgi:hypothetical protein